MRQLVLWYHRLTIWPKLLLKSLITAIPFYFAAILSNSVSKTSELTQPYSLLIHAFCFILSLTLIVFGYRIFSLYNEQFIRDQEQLKENLLHSHTLCSRIITNQIRRINSQYSNLENFAEIFITSLFHIQSIIDAAYAFFESEYGKSYDGNDRVDFEVTFMTKSYLDNFITIPASSNKDGRSPHSMLLRNENPGIYENTVTADVYRSAKPSCMITENTDDEKFNYTEIYTNQKKRIKSSIVYPIFSDRHELLGTLVVHCDKKFFFRLKDLKRWSDILEIFSKKIALEKIKMDKLIELDKLLPIHIENMEKY